MSDDVSDEDYGFDEPIGPPSGPDSAFLMRRSAQMLEDDPKVAREAFAAAAQANMEPCPSCGKRIKHRKGLGWCQDDVMSEADLQKRIRGRAKSRGWEVVHIGKAVPAYDEAGKPVWITSAPEGWPDLMLFKVGMPHPVIAMELKRQSNEPTPKQMDWLVLLNQCGIPAVVVKPNDLREGRVNAILEGR